MRFSLNGKVEGKMHQIPADFLIDKTGIIEIAHYGNSIFDPIDLNEVLKIRNNLSNYLKFKE
jgi:hypothetical protein